MEEHPELPFQADQLIRDYADERDLIQEKTFVKWINSRLSKTNTKIKDLFSDFRDGLNLILLVEQLTGEHLERERGKRDIQILNNITTAFNFLAKKNVKLYNIEPLQIMKGNRKLTLGLIWAIILRFQMQVMLDTGHNQNIKKAVLSLVNTYVCKYSSEPVTNFTTSWYDGKNLTYLVYHQNKAEIDLEHVLSTTTKERLEFVFEFANQNYGVDCLLEAEDLLSQKADEQSVMTYVSTLCSAIKDYTGLTNVKQEYKMITDWMAFYDAKFRKVMENDNFEELESENINVDLFFRFLTESKEKVGEMKALSEKKLEIKKIYGESEKNLIHHMNINSHKLQELYSEAMAKYESMVKTHKKISQYYTILQEKLIRVSLNLNEFENAENANISDYNGIMRAVEEIEVICQDRNTNMPMVSEIEFLGITAKIAEFKNAINDRLQTIKESDRQNQKVLTELHDYMDPKLEQIQNCLQEIESLRDSGMLGKCTTLISMLNQDQFVPIRKYLCEQTTSLTNERILYYTEQTDVLQKRLDSLVDQIEKAKKSFDMSEPDSSNRNSLAESPDLDAQTRNDEFESLGREDLELELTKIEEMGANLMSLIVREENTGRTNLFNRELADLHNSQLAVSYADHVRFNEDYFRRLFGEIRRCDSIRESIEIEKWHNINLDVSSCFARFSHENCDPDLFREGFRIARESPNLVEFVMKCLNKLYLSTRAYNRSMECCVAHTGCITDLDQFRILLNKSKKWLQDRHDNLKVFSNQISRSEDIANVEKQINKLFEDVCDYYQDIYKLKYLASRVVAINKRKSITNETEGFIIAEPNDFINVSDCSAEKRVTILEQIDGTTWKIKPPERSVKSCYVSFFGSDSDIIGRVEKVITFWEKLRMNCVNLTGDINKNSTNFTNTEILKQDFSEEIKSFFNLAVSSIEENFKEFLSTGASELYSESKSLFELMEERMMTLSDNKFSFNLQDDKEFNSFNELESFISNSMEKCREYKIKMELSMATREKGIECRNKLAVYNSLLDEPVNITVENCNEKYSYYTKILSQLRNDSIISGNIRDIKISYQFVTLYHPSTWLTNDIDGVTRQYQKITSEFEKIIYSIENFINQFLAIMNSHTQIGSFIRRLEDTVEETDWDKVTEEVTGLLSAVERENSIIKEMETFNSSLNYGSDPYFIYIINDVIKPQRSGLFRLLKDFILCDRNLNAGNTLTGMIEEFLAANSELTVDAIASSVGGYGDDLEKLDEAQIDEFDGKVRELEESCKKFELLDDIYEIFPIINTLRNNLNECESMKSELEKISASRPKLETKVGKCKDLVQGLKDWICGKIEIFEDVSNTMKEVFSSFEDISHNVGVMEGSELSIEDKLSMVVENIKQLESNLEQFNRTTPKIDSVVPSFTQSGCTSLRDLRDHVENEILGELGKSKAEFERLSKFTELFESVNLVVREFNSLPRNDELSETELLSQRAERIEFFKKMYNYLKELFDLYSHCDDPKYCENIEEYMTILCSNIRTCQDSIAFIEKNIPTLVLQYVGGLFDKFAVFVNNFNSGNLKDLQATADFLKVNFDSTCSFLSENELFGSAEHSELLNKINLMVSVVDEISVDIEGNMDLENQIVEEDETPYKSTLEELSRISFDEVILGDLLKTGDDLLDNSTCPRIQDFCSKFKYSISSPSSLLDDLSETPKTEKKLRFQVASQECLKSEGSFGNSEDNLARLIDEAIDYFVGIQTDLLSTHNINYEYYSLVEYLDHNKKIMCQVDLRKTEIQELLKQSQNQIFNKGKVDFSLRTKGKRLESLITKVINQCLKNCQLTNELTASLKQWIQYYDQFDFNYNELSSKLELIVEPSKTLQGLKRQQIECDEILHGLRDLKSVVENLKITSSLLSVHMPCDAIVAYKDQLKDCEVLCSEFSCQLNNTVQLVRDAMSAHISVEDEMNDVGNILSRIYDKTQKLDLHKLLQDSEILYYYKEVEELESMTVSAKKTLKVISSKTEDQNYIDQLNEMNSMIATIDASLEELKTTMQVVLKTMNEFYDKYRHVESLVENLDSQLDGFSELYSSDISSQLGTLESFSVYFDEIESEYRLLREIADHSPCLLNNINKFEIDEKCLSIGTALSKLKNDYATKLGNYRLLFSQMDLIHREINNLLEWLQDIEPDVETAVGTESDEQNVVKLLESTNDIRKMILPRYNKVNSLTLETGHMLKMVEANDIEDFARSVEDVDMRFSDTLKTISDREYQLQIQAINYGHIMKALEEANKWITTTLDVISSIQSNEDDIQSIEIDLYRIRNIFTEIEAHEGNMERIKESASAFFNDDPENQSAVSQIDLLDKNWEELKTLCKHKIESLKSAIDKISNIDEKTSHLSYLLDNINLEFENLGDYSCTIASAECQLDEINNILDKLRKMAKNLEDLKSFENPSKTQSVCERYEVTLEVLSNKKKLTEENIKRIGEFQRTCLDFEEILTSLEVKIGGCKAPSFLYERNQKQLKELEEIGEIILQNIAKKNNLEEIVIKMRYYGRKGDVIAINNSFDYYNRSFSRISDIVDNRIRNVAKISPIALKFKKQYEDIISWINGKKDELKMANQQRLCVEDLGSLHSEHLAFHDCLVDKQGEYDKVRLSVRKMIDVSPKSDKSTFADFLTTITSAWHSLIGLSFHRQRILDEAITVGGSLSDALSNNFSWMMSTLKKLQLEYENYYGCSEYISSMLNNCQIIKYDIEQRQKILSLLQDKINQVGDVNSAFDSFEVAKYEDMLTLWSQIQNTAAKNFINLTEAHKEVLQFETKLDEMKSFIDKKREVIDMKINLSDTSTDALERRVALFKKIQDEFNRHRDNFNILVCEGTEIIGKCNDESANELSKIVDSFIDSWNETESLVSLRKGQMLKTIGERRDKIKHINSLYEELAALKAEIADIDHNFNYNASFSQLMSISDRLREVENKMKNKRESVETVIRKDLRRNPSSFEIKSNVGRFRTNGVAKIDSLWKDSWTRISELNKQLKKLIEKRGEIEKLDNFSVQEWLSAMKTKMSRKNVTPNNLFNKIDKNQDGVIDRTDFTMMILKLFPTWTSKSELERVWSLMKFKSREGVRLERFVDGFGTLSNIKRKERTIDSEIDMISERCTCAKKFSIHKVGEGVYKFGDSNIKRLVRITPSAAMVRVGGGWCPLQDFLLRYDPCQLKRRTTSNRSITGSVDSVESVETKLKRNAGSTEMKFQKKLSREFKPSSGVSSVNNKPISPSVVRSLPRPSASVRRNPPLSPKKRSNDFR